MENEDGMPQKKAPKQFNIDLSKYKKGNNSAKSNEQK